jgi:DNA-binding NarL/FixJ family response regulator
MRILIADDHELVRETIAMFLLAEGFADVMTANNVAETLETLDKSGSFDLVLLDYNMTGMDGLAGLARVIAANEGKPVALISGEATPRVAGDAIEAGARGFVPKTLGTKAMISAIRFMVSGEVFVPFDFMQKPETRTVADLTARETEVLRGICHGKSNKEIARDLDLREVTIKLHVKTLCRKLDAKNRTQAAMIATERNLL